MILPIPLKAGREGTIWDNRGLYIYALAAVLHQLHICASRHLNHQVLLYTLNYMPL